MREINSDPEKTALRMERDFDFLFVGEVKKTAKSPILQEIPINKRTNNKETIITPKQEAVAAEAQRCYEPSIIPKCPIGINLEHAIMFVKQKKFAEAREIIEEHNPFPSLCGRLCTAPCEKNPQNIKVKLIERFLGDNYDIMDAKPKFNKKSIGIVGGGVSGMYCGAILSKKGYNITIYEAMNELGGALNISVPSFRLNKNVLSNCGKRATIYCKIQHNIVVGWNMPLKELTNMHDSVILATGANKPSMLNIPGENIRNVHTAVEVFNHGLKGGFNTIVVGGGDLALDAARHLAKQGDTVTLLYRKNIDDIRVDPENIHYAQEEGVHFMLLTDISKIVGEKQVEGIECVQLMKGGQDFDGSTILVPIEDSEFQIPCTRVILATGFDPNPTISASTPIRTIGKGRIWTDEKHRTSIPKVFAAGEIATGPSNFEDILVHSKLVVESVEEYLTFKEKAEPKT